ncbi:hypothetical protein Prum_070490 [Phytohabitans rumicis]|uniref:Uncharacterized protein n=1 Tax=Phytohabitans rumicis TaxID=1076125 RepID=A0A6V8LH46_9ACTN|nr:hypothetical protein Prum_070490 [Phytohabitans rumicis]
MRNPLGFEAPDGRYNSDSWEAVAETRPQLKKIGDLRKLRVMQGSSLSLSWGLSAGRDFPSSMRKNYYLARMELAPVGRWSGNSLREVKSATPAVLDTYCRL